MCLRLGGIEALNFYQDSSNQNAFNFCYINNCKNYLVNQVNNLFQNQGLVTMFVNKDIYTIHLLNQPCGLPEEKCTDYPNVQKQMNQFLLDTYPKQKFLNIVFNMLVRNNFINEDLFFESFSNIHIADFCSFINNRFDKTDKPNGRLLKLCKYLQSKKIKFPTVCIKNPNARKYLC